MDRRPLVRDYDHNTARRHPINTLDGKWNNSTIVEQLNDLIRSFSSRARRDAVLRNHPPSKARSENQ